jgi:hypothetical protein
MQNDVYTYIEYSKNGGRAQYWVGTFLFHQFELTDIRPGVYLVQARYSALKLSFIFIHPQTPPSRTMILGYWFIRT